jgi:hypothetical protein
MDEFRNSYVRSDDGYMSMNDYYNATRPSREYYSPPPAVQNYNESYYMYYRPHQEKSSDPSRHEHAIKKSSYYDLDSAYL